MESMIAYCGLICDTCPIHIATLENDHAVKPTLRESIAEICSRQYGMDLTSEDITDCDGCKSGSGKLFSGCMNCEIRKCAVLKNVNSCAFCADYACKILQNFFLVDAEARERLEKLRNEN